jgi:hypothetical protein
MTLLGRLAFKDTFFVIHLSVQGKLGFKTSDQKEKNHKDMGSENIKKINVLFE